MTDLPGWGGLDQPQPGQGMPTGQESYGSPVRSAGWPGGRPAGGGVPLRPLGIGDILSGIVSLVRFSPGATIGLNAIGAATSGALAAITAFIAGRTGTGAVVLGELLVALSYAAVGGAVIAAMGQALLGRKIGIAEAVRRSRMGWVLMTAAAYWIVIAAVWTAALIVAHGYGILLAFPLATWLGIMAWLSFPVVVLERRRTIAAMGRSWRLVRGSFWRLLGIFALMFVISGVLIVIFWLVGSFAGTVGAILSGGGDSPASAGALISLVLLTLLSGFVLGTILTGLWTGLTVLLYADMRMRKEGMDLLLRQAAADRALTGEEFASILASP